MFIQKIRVRKGMKAYYSELPNKQADQNKCVGIGGKIYFSSNRRQIASMMENVLICYIKNESMVEKNSKKHCDHARLLGSSK